MANYQNIWIDYYEVLSVDRTSSKDEIKKSYKKLARDNHPDLHPEAEQNEYKEKLQLINEAYDVLSNDEKRKEYDYMYDERKNRLADTDFPTAEDIQKEMTEEEKRWAEILAFQEIIKEELKKVNIIIDSINEITYWAYSEEVEKFDYYDKYKELESISYEYFRSLNELSKKAYEYDLLDEIHVINNTIDYVKEQLANLPTNPTDARKLYEETNKKQSVTDLIKKHINNTNNIISQLDSIIKYVSRNEITRTEYSIILKSIKLDVQSNISSLTNLAKVATLLNMEKDSDICINHISELQTKIDDIPEEYEDAIKYAEAIKITKECNRLYNKYNTFLWDTVKRKISYLENNIDIDDWYEIYDEITSDITKVESGLIKIKNEFNKLSKFSKNDDLEKLYNDAIKNFLEADNLHVKTRKIYFTIKENNKKLTQDDLIDLFNGTTSYYDKCKAIELLIEITKLKIKTKKYDKLNKEIDTLEDLISQLSGNIDYFKQSKHYATRMRTKEKERQEQLKFLQKKIDEYSSQLSEEKDNWAKSKIKFTSFLSKTKELAKEGIVLSSAGICSISIAIPQGIAVLTRNGYHEFSSVALAILFTMGGIATTAMAKKSFKNADSYKSKYNEEINIYAKHEANCKKLEREIDYYTRKKQKY